MTAEALKKLKTAESEKISHIDYFNIAISVDCVIFGFEKKELRVLLIKSDLEEFADKWSLLGDLVKIRYRDNAFRRSMLTHKYNLFCLSVGVQHERSHK